MKKSILTFSVLLFSLTAFSQKSDSLAIVQLKQKVGQLQTETKSQKSDFSEQVKALQAQVEELSTQFQHVQQTVDSQGFQVADARAVTEQQIANVEKSLCKTTLWAIIGILLAIIIPAVLYCLLRKKQQSDKTAMTELLNKTKKEIAEQLSDAKSDMAKQLSHTKTDMAGQLNNTKKEMTEQLNKTKSSIEEDLTKELSKQTELIDALKKELSSSKKKTSQTKKEA